MCVFVCGCGCGLIPAIQSFQTFVLEQTDEPSAEESLQQYAEFASKYVEVRQISLSLSLSFEHPLSLLLYSSLSPSLPPSPISKQDYSKMVFEEKRSEEWFADRYLPSARLEKSVEAKREWAKQEAGRFSVRKGGREGGREGREGT